MSIGPKFYDSSNIDLPAKELFLRLGKDKKLHFEKKETGPARFLQKIKFFFDPEFRKECRLGKILPFIAKEIEKINIKGSVSDQEVEEINKVITLVNEICNRHLEKKGRKQEAVFALFQKKLQKEEQNELQKMAFFHKKIRIKMPQIVEEEGKEDLFVLYTHAFTDSASLATRQLLAPGFIRCVLEDEENQKETSFHTLLESATLASSDLAVEERQKMCALVEKKWAVLPQNEKQEEVVRYLEFQVNNWPFMKLDFSTVKNFFDKNRVGKYESLVINYMRAAWSQVRDSLTREDLQLVKELLGTFFPTKQPLNSASNVQDYLKYLHSRLQLKSGLEAIGQGRIEEGLRLLHTLYQQDPSLREMIVYSIENSIKKFDNPELLALVKDYLMQVKTLAAEKETPAIKDMPRIVIPVEKAPPEEMPEELEPNDLLRQVVHGDTRAMEQLTAMLYLEDPSLSAEEKHKLIIQMLLVEETLDKEALVQFAKKYGLLPYLAEEFLAKQLFNETKTLLTEIEASTSISDVQKKSIAARYYMAQKDYGQAFKVAGDDKEIIRCLQLEKKAEEQLKKFVSGAFDAGIAFSELIMNNKEVFSQTWIISLKEVIEQMARQSKEHPEGIAVCLRYLLDENKKQQWPQIVELLASCSVENQEVFLQQFMENVSMQNSNAKKNLVATFIESRRLDWARIFLEKVAPSLTVEDNLVLSARIYLQDPHGRKLFEARKNVEDLLEMDSTNQQGLELLREIQKRMSSKPPSPKTAMNVLAVEALKEKEKKKLLAIKDIVEATEAANQGYFTLAKQFYEEARKKDPDDPIALEGLALLYGKEKTISTLDAIGYLQQVRRLRGGSLSIELTRYLKHLEEIKSQEGHEKTAKEIGIYERLGTFEVKAKEEPQPSDDIKRRAEELQKQKQQIDEKRRAEGLKEEEGS
jgi:hypothetical protein